MRFGVTAKTEKSICLTVSILVGTGQEGKRLVCGITCAVEDADAQSAPITGDFKLHHYRQSE